MYYTNDKYVVGTPTAHNPHENENENEHFL